jgi:hypothetical protein
MAQSTKPAEPPAGYSGTPLPKKLGIKAGSCISFPGAPESFLETLGELPEGVEAADAALDVVVFFVRSEAELRDGFERWSKAITPAGMLWIGWPKKASGVRTDLTENVVREIALELGMVDVKVAAIDATWSGLKLVYRLRDRGKR